MVKNCEIFNNYNVWRPLATFFFVPVASRELLLSVLIFLSKQSNVRLEKTYHVRDLILEVVEK